MMIPRVIYQTWKTKDRDAWTRSMRRWVGSWEQKNPGFEHRLFDDADCRAFVERHFPEHLGAYMALIPVEKADWWRYMAIFVSGGVYCDIDAVCCAPLERWPIHDDRLVVALELDFRDKYPNWAPSGFLESGGAFDVRAPWCDNVIIFCNWAFAAPKGHPLLADVLRRVAINLKDPHFRDVHPNWTVKKTGPGVLTDAIYGYLEQQGVTPGDVANELRRNKELTVGDIRFLDNGAFHGRLARHVGLGSWKEPGHLIASLIKKVELMFR